jgi:hypothetical protein
MRNLTLAMIALAAFGCARGGRPRARRSPVTVTESGLGLALAPRPADCVVEFYRTTVPQRPHDEVATLHFRGSMFANAAGAQEKMREQACALGADAVLVSRDFVPGTQWSPSVMTGTAVSYRDAREQHRVDGALRRAEADRAAAELEAERRAASSPAPAVKGATSADTPAHASGAPAGYVRGRLKETVWPRATAERRSAETGEVRAGSDVWIAPQPSSGWRRIWAPGGTAGWVEDSAVERLEPAAPPAPASPAPERAAPLPTTSI